MTAGKPESRSRRPIAIVPGRLYVLGGVVPAHDDINWLPDGRRGYESINAYLLTEPSRALFIDTGVALQREAIIEQATELLAPPRAVEIFLTRAEPDAAGNLGELIQTFNVRRAYTGGRSNPFDFFEEASGGIELEMKRVADAVPGRIRSGDPIELSPTRDVVSITPALRLLSTSWAFDHETRTLFTSDSFGQFGLRSPEANIFMDELASEGDYTMTREWLLTKFDWLEGARLASIRDSIANVALQFPTEYVAPTHGRILRGRAVVQSHFDLLLEILGELGASAAAHVF